MDHAHILHMHFRTRTIADVVGAVKRDSAGWIKQQVWARGNVDFHRFHWQRGYGVFAMSESKVKDVCAYIDGRMEHHGRVTFEEESREFLRRHGIEFDERYVWD